MQRNVIEQQDAGYRGNPLQAHATVTCDTCKTPVAVNSKNPIGAYLEAVRHATRTRHKVRVVYHSPVEPPV